MIWLHSVTFGTKHKFLLFLIIDFIIILETLEACTATADTHWVHSLWMRGLAFLGPRSSQLLLMGLQMKQGICTQGKCFIQRCLYLNISCSSAAILMFYLTSNHLIKEIKMLPIFGFHSSLIVLSLYASLVCSSSLLAGHLFSFTSLSPIPPSNPRTHTRTHRPWLQLSSNTFLAHDLPPSLSDCLQMLSQPN